MKGERLSRWNSTPSDSPPQLDLGPIDPGVRSVVEYAGAALGALAEMEVHMKLVVLGVFAVTGLSSTAFAADCLAVATKDIEQKGFTVEESFLEEIARPSNSGTNAYSAWFRVTKCDKGYLIVNMHAGCQIHDHWAAGQCEIPEIHAAIGER